MLLEVVVMKKHYSGIWDNVVDDELESEHDSFSVYVHVFGILKQEVYPAMISH